MNNDTNKTLQKCQLTFDLNNSQQALEYEMLKGIPPRQRSEFIHFALAFIGRYIRYTYPSDGMAGVVFSLTNQIGESPPVDMGKAETKVNPTISEATTPPIREKPAREKPVEDEADKVAEKPRSRPDNFSVEVSIPKENKPDNNTTSSDTASKNDPELDDKIRTNLFAL